MEISIDANPKEIASLVLALQGRSDEEVCPEKMAQVIRGALLEQAQLSKSPENQEFLYEFRVYCLARHFSVWFEDIKNDRMPDFGSPCQGCRNQETCHAFRYPWLDILNPLLQSHGININLAQKGQ